METKNTASQFTLNYCAALDDDSLYLAGVANELEDRDVHHTIIWERLGDTWKRYQWKNRTYGLIAYSINGSGIAAYMGYEGTIKVRDSSSGWTAERIDVGDDGPSSLRTISSIRNIGDYLYVAGMRRMVYRRKLNSAAWTKFDDGLRLERSDLALAGLYSIDGLDPLPLYAVGISGEIWKCAKDGWHPIDSPTNLTLMTVRCTNDGQVIAGGEKGALLACSRDLWVNIDHEFPEETFTCIERWRGRYFISSDAGRLYELLLADTPSLTKLTIDGMPRVSWIASTSHRIWFAGGTSVVSLGDDGWRQESPSTSLLG